MAEAETIDDVIKIAQALIPILLELDKSQGEKSNIALIPASSFQIPLVMSSIMGRLSGFSYREVTRKLKKFGFEFYRSGKGDHEIRFTSFTRMKTTITPSQVDSRKHSPKYSQIMPS